jgi:hypothetical protein
VELSKLNQLCSAISEGPAILFLGQEVLHTYAGEDLFLSTCAARFGLPGVGTYKALLTSWQKEDPPQLGAILHNISMRLAVPEALETVAQLPWNAVITSCFHDVIERALYAEWRTVGAVLGRQSPADPRSRQRLHVFKLFGTVVSDKEEEQPPRSPLRLIQRQATANEMLAKLPELVTPRGVLLIDGFGTQDWISSEGLAAQVALLGEGQAHLFDANANPERLGTLGLLVDAGKLTIHNEPLSELIARARHAGLLRPDAHVREWTEGVRVQTRSGNERTFDPAGWRQLTRGLPVLSDADLESPPPFPSQEDKYKAFREFVYGTHGTPRWPQLNCGFQFRRPQFHRLVEAVDSELSKARLKERPVLLCGQSGVGKTIALADLALAMRRKKWHVLFLARTYAELDYAQVGAVCEALEAIDNTSTLLIWDALAEGRSYEMLSTYLASRGRKALVVGSAYAADTKYQCVEYEPRMTHQEAVEFWDHLKRIDNRIVEGVDPRDFEQRHFLAWLWRLLPEVRGTIRAGLLREYEVYEEGLDKQLLEPQPAYVRPGTFGALLKEALGDAFPTAFDESATVDVRDASGREAAKVQRLSGLILIPGRYGQDVPIDLLLRCLGTEGFDLLRKALKKVAVYQWVEDERGNPSIGARHRVEADIMVRARFTREEEMEVIQLLIGSVRLRSEWQLSNPEVAFVQNLLRAVGPDSLRDPSAAELESLADTLKELRDNSGSRAHPQLLFQEGHFRREALLRLRNDLASTPDVMRHVMRMIDQYQKARDALQQCDLAYQTTDQPRRHAYALSFLHTEFATLFGYAQDLQADVAQRDPQSDALPLLNNALQEGFDEAIRHCKLASLYSSDNAYPADVRFRVTKARLARADDKSRLALVSELCDVLDEESWTHEPERYERRRLELAELIGDESLRANALAALTTLGSLEGHYFLIWNQIFYADRTFRGRAEVMDGVSAIDRLGQPAMLDRRMVRLYCRAWWQAFGNPRLFAPESERITAALSHDQWDRYASWLAQRVSFSDDASVHARFAYAWALYQCERFREAEDQFRTLDRETSAGKYRVIRLATWCDEKGAPIACDGTVRRAQADSARGYVYVPRIRREIPFQVRDFADQELSRGERMIDFYISFNFLGPLADPVRYWRR